MLPATLDSPARQVGGEGSGSMGMGFVSRLRGRGARAPDEELDRNVEEEIARNLWVRCLDLQPASCLPERPSPPSGRCTQHIPRWGTASPRSACAPQTISCLLAMSARQTTRCCRPTAPSKSGGT
mgnify:CR=1 FL=1